jgi:hypothetical protein
MKCGILEWVDGAVNLCGNQEGRETHSKAGFNMKLNPGRGWGSISGFIRVIRGKGYGRFNMEISEW